MTDGDGDQRPTISFATHGKIGLLLIVAGWAANWFLPGPRTHIFFAPLWVGFALSVDALVLLRTGTSIITRSYRSFVLLFVLSAPVWWTFELFNLRTQNWIYLGRELFTDFEFFLLSTISFSTVMPAVFEAAELVASFRWTKRLTGGVKLGESRALRATFLALGVTSLALVLIWPNTYYPLVWGVLFFFCEPVNQGLRRPSLFRYLGKGDWRPVVSLALGALLCGFFWELWNMYSYPKWTYDTPGVNWAHLFEMPALGYIGYLPFGLELYSIASLLSGREFVRFEAMEPFPGG